eukprot:UN29003
MGFKPFERLKPYHNLKPAYFMYPDEPQVEGSTVCFSALLEEMIKLGKIAICRFIYRKSSVPRFAALLPQKETFNEHDEQEKPPGFHVIFLPYADDIRKIPLAPKKVADENLILQAKKVIQKLSLVRFPEYVNPVLQRFYDGLEALALDEDIPQEITDETTQDLEVMADQGREVLEDFAK